MGQLKKFQPLPSVTGKGQQINTCSFSTQSCYAACYKEERPCSKGPCSPTDLWHHSLCDGRVFPSCEDYNSSCSAASTCPGSEAAAQR